MMLSTRQVLQKAVYVGAGSVPSVAAPLAKDVPDEVQLCIAVFGHSWELNMRRVCMGLEMAVFMAGVSRLGVGAARVVVFRLRARCFLGLLCLFSIGPHINMLNASGDSSRGQWNRPSRSAATVDSSGSLTEQ
jgi:hypothetical protein